MAVVVRESRDLLICNNCFWAASLLKDSYSSTFPVCPIYGKREIEIIPVSDYEYYKMNINKRKGIDIEFLNEK